MVASGVCRDPVDHVGPSRERSPTWETGVVVYLHLLLTVSTASCPVLRSCMIPTRRGGGRLTANWPTSNWRPPRFITGTTALWKPIQHQDRLSKCGVPMINIRRSWDRLYLGNSYTGKVNWLRQKFYIESVLYLGPGHQHSPAFHEHCPMSWQLGNYPMCFNLFVEILLLD